MVAKSTCILAIALVLLAGPAVQAQDTGIKGTIDQAVQDAMQSEPPRPLPRRRSQTDPSLA